MAGEPVLERNVGLPSAVGFGLGAMVGTGVFVTTAVGAGMAGPAVLVSLVLAGIAAACNGLSSAELAMVYPRSGGTYEYAGRRLSPWSGFLAGWLFLAAKSTSAAATALGFGTYVGALTGLPPLAVSIGLVVGVTILCLFRLTKAGVVNLALVVVSAAALITFIAVGLPGIDAARFTPFAPYGARGILTAGSLLFVAYAGYGRVATLGEEIANPKRNIPIAVVLSLIAAASLYILVTTTAVGTIGAEAFAAAAAGKAPLEAAAGSGWLRLFLGVGAATALGSVFLNLLLGLSRMLFAMSRGGDLPSGLTRLNAASSPFAAVLVMGTIVGSLVALRDIVVLLSISAFAVLVYYSFTNLSALRLGRDERLVPPAVPALGLIFCLGLAANVPPKQMAIGAGILAAGVVWRLIWRRAAPTS